MVDCAGYCLWLLLSIAYILACCKGYSVEKVCEVKNELTWSVSISADRVIKIVVLSLANLGLNNL